MSRKSIKEKIGIFFITLGVLGGLYGLFLSLTHNAVASTQDVDQAVNQQDLKHQRALDELAFAKEELEDTVEAFRKTKDELERAVETAETETNTLKRTMASETDIMMKLVGYVDGETGVDGIEGFLNLVRRRLAIDGQVLIPGGVVLAQGHLTLEKLHELILPQRRKRHYSI